VKPTEDEWQAAKAAIEIMRESGDPEHVAKLMHYLEYKSELLEKVCHHAQLYVQFGLDEQEHTALVKAVERWCLPWRWSTVRSRSGFSKSMPSRRLPDPAD